MIDIYGLLLKVDVLPAESCYFSDTTASSKKNCKERKPVFIYRMFLQKTKIGSLLLFGKCVPYRLVLSGFLLPGFNLL